MRSTWFAKELKVACLSSGGLHFSVEHTGWERYVGDGQNVSFSSDSWSTLEDEQEQSVSLSSEISKRAKSDKAEPPTQRKTAGASCFTSSLDHYERFVVKLTRQRRAYLASIHN